MKTLVFFILFSLNAFSQGLSYLTPQSIDLSEIPSPPVSDLKELHVVLNLQSLRDASLCERINFESEGFATSFFGPPYGPLTIEEASGLVDFQEKLFQEAKFFFRILKEKWKKPRPYTMSSEVRPCIPLERSFSYPSGHSAIAIIAAKTFSLLYPELREELLVRAYEVGEGRIIGGVHFPSDVHAGRVLGEKIFNALLESTDFLKDVSKLRKSDPTALGKTVKAPAL